MPCMPPRSEKISPPITERERATSEPAFIELCVLAEPTADSIKSLMESSSGRDLPNCSSCLSRSSSSVLPPPSLRSTSLSSLWACSALRSSWTISSRGTGISTLTSLLGSLRHQGRCVLLSETLPHRGAGRALFTGGHYYVAP